MSVFPFSIETKEVYLKNLSKGVRVMYVILLIILLICVFSLPFLYVDITVKAPGHISSLPMAAELMGQPLSNNYSTNVIREKPVNSDGIHSTEKIKDQTVTPQNPGVSGNMFVAECYVAPGNVGRVHPKQKVKIRLEDFDPSQFGVITGSVLLIDDDYSIIENKPRVRVLCQLSDTQVSAKTGFVGKVKNGLRVQAQIVTARRSIWQLLFDKTNGGRNPQDKRNSDFAKN